MGYAVGFGQWCFFADLAPAVALGRAARMSSDCHGYGIYQAARDLTHCDQHGDELVLLVDLHAEIDRTDHELELRMLKRFVQSVKEHLWSAHWQEPTGYISAYNNGRPTPTTRKSLPL